MQFGFIFAARDLRATAELAALGERLGFHLMGVGDTPSLCYDPFVALGVAAGRTSRIRLGTAVTNPQTRHPLILANLTAALEHLAPGRAFLGLGIGNSGVRQAGAAPATMDTLEETVGTVRRLLAGEAVEVGGAPTRVHGDRRRTPVLLACSGPKSLRQAGRIADAVWINLGLSPEILADGMRWVREGAEAEGRDPSQIEVWAFGLGAIADSREQARDEATGPAVGIAAYVLKGDAKTKRIPPQVAAKVDELLRGYRYGEHFLPGRTANHQLAAQLGLTDYLLERFAVAGTPEDCKAKVAALREAGVTRLCLSFSGAPDPAAYVRQFGEKVLPAFG